MTFLVGCQYFMGAASYMLYHTDFFSDIADSLHDLRIFNGPSVRRNNSSEALLEPIAHADDLLSAEGAPGGICCLFHHLYVFRG